MVLLGLLLPVGSIPAQEASAESDPERIARSCFDFMAGLTNFSVDCMRLEDAERRVGKSYVVHAELPGRLRVFHDAYFNPHIWDYADGAVSVFLPGSGELRRHPAEAETFPFAAKDHADPTERGLHNSLFLPDLLSGRMADRVLSNAADRVQATGRPSGHNGAVCQWIRVEQRDQTAYELLIQVAGPPFPHAIKQTTARTNVVHSAGVDQKVLLEEMYRKWQWNSPEIHAQLAQPLKPDPVELSPEDEALREGVLRAADGYEPQPIPARTASCHQDRVRRQFNALYRDKILAQAGADPSRRAELEQLLDAYIGNLATGEPDSAALLARTTEWMGKAPEIPIVNYVHACVLTSTHTANPRYVGIPQPIRKEIMEKLEAAHAGFQTPEWSHPYLAMRSAYRRAAADVNPRPERTAQAWEEFRRLLEDPDMVEHHGDQLVGDWEDFIRGPNSPLSKQRLEKMREFQFLEGTQPWVYHMLMGVGHLSEGWDRDEYLRAQDDHIRQAMVHLAKAYELEPNRPEAAGYMITALLAGGGGRAGMRQWFDRAVRAEMDYLPAYGRYMAVLAPAWGGGDEERLAFGEECLKTGRFDTRVPGLYLDALEATAKRDATPRATYRRPGCHEHLMELMEGWKNRADDSRGADYWESRKAVYAWACGRPAEASEILRGLGERFDETVLRPFGVDPGQFAEEVWTQGGAHAAEYEAARACLDSGDVAAARRTIEGVLGALSETDSSRPFFQRVLSRCGVAEAWGRGEWVSLMSPDAIAWECRTGGWKRDGQAWMCASENGLDARLDCRFPLTGDCELEGAVEFVEVTPADPHRHPTRTLNFTFGEPFDGRGPHSGVRIALRDRPAQAAISGLCPDRELEGMTVDDIPVEGREEFRLRRQGGKLSFWWGGTLVADGLDLKMTEADPDRPGSFSLQVYDGKNGRFVVRLDGLRARKGIE